MKRTSKLGLALVTAAVALLGTGCSSICGSCEEATVKCAPSCCKGASSCKGADCCKVKKDTCKKSDCCN